MGKARATVTCAVCGVRRHNRRTCPSKCDVCGLRRPCPCTSQPQSSNELFTATCREAQEQQWGELTIVLDDAAYDKRLTSPKDRLEYWSALKSADVLEAWENSMVPGQEHYNGPAIKHKCQIINWLRQTIDDELLSNLAEGLEGVEGVPVPSDMRGGMLPKEVEAVSALLSLRNL